MDDLTAFLNARLNEKQQFAERLLAHPPYGVSGMRGIAEQMLREVEAGRKIAAEYAPVAGNDGPGEPEYAYGWAEGLGTAIRALAAAWSDHPDYRPEP